MSKNSKTGQSTDGRHPQKLSWKGTKKWKRYSSLLFQLSNGSWIVRRDNKQIQIKKGIPQSLKSYDGNGNYHRK